MTLALGQCKGITVFSLAMVISITSALGVMSQDTSSHTVPDDSSAVENYRGSALQSGFLFADGVYIAPPYSFHYTGSVASVVVNDGNAITWPLAGRKINGNRQRFDKADDRERGSDEERARRVEMALAKNKVVVVWSNRSALILDGYRQAMFLSWLLEAERSPLEKEALPEWFPIGLDALDWNAAFSKFQGSAEFALRARPEIAKILAADEADTKHRSAKRLFDYASYPLLALSMLFIAITTGHLMGCHATMIKGIDDGSEAMLQQDMMRCLVLIALFAMVDLIWTVLAARAGQIHELNPVARQLISNPYSLVGFKFATTVGALLILYGWRHRRFARQATWWSCLICMMVAVRWVLQAGII